MATSSGAQTPGRDTHGDKADGENTDEVPPTPLLWANHPLWGTFGYETSMRRTFGARSVRKDHLGWRYTYYYPGLDNRGATYEGAKLEAHVPQNPYPDWNLECTDHVPSWQVRPDRG